jgi:hypothetical protein
MAYLVKDRGIVF